MSPSVTGVCTVRADDQPLDLLDRRELAINADGQGGAVVLDRADRHADVVRLQDLANRVHGNAAVGERRRVDQDLKLVLGPADDLDAADALGGGQRRQELRLRDGAERLGVGVLTAGQADLVDRELLEVDALDIGLLRAVRHGDAADRAGQLLLALRHVVAVLILGNDDREALGRRRGCRLDAGEAGDDLAQRQGDLLVNRLRAGAGVDGDGGEDRHLDVRDELRLQPGHGEHAGKGDQEREEHDDSSLPERDGGQT